VQARTREELVAQDLADVLARGSGKTWRKVTTILDAIGVHRLTPGVRNRLAAAFAAAGVDARPEWQQVQRFESVRFTLRKEPPRATAEGVEEHPAVVRITEWRPGHPYREISLAEALNSQHVIWIELDAMSADLETITRVLTPVCPGLTASMIDDLLEAEPFPKVTYWDQDRRVRTIASFAAVAEEDVDDSRVGLAGRLLFHILELVAADRWIVSSWHPTKVYVGAVESDEPAGGFEILGDVSDRWLRDGSTTAGELGTLALYRLAMTYTDTRRILHAWLESWELEFFRKAATDVDPEFSTLIELRGLIGQLSKRTRAMKLPRAIQRESWFSGVENIGRAKEVDEMLDRALDDFARLAEQVRSAFDLVQLQVSRRQQSASEEVQRSLALIAAVFLVPTLIAGIYGANTKLPGGEKWTGFAAMLVLMLVFSVGAFVWLTHRARRGSVRD
jgi:hypothetical protein